MIIGTQMMDLIAYKSLWRKAVVLVDQHFFSFIYNILSRFLHCLPNKGLCDKGLTLYHTIPTFNDPQERYLLKTWWEKEKMLVTSIFSFSHNVFYPVKFVKDGYQVVSKFNLNKLRNM